MILNRLFLPTLFLLLAGFCLTACGRAQTPPSVTGSFVGTVEGTDAFISLVSQTDQQLVAYICDGQTISTWFRGERNENQVDLLAPSGVRLQASIENGRVTGSVTLAEGRVHPFTASPADGEAGLYRAEQTINDTRYVGGWIVLNDGTQQGLINRISDGTSNITDGTSNTFTSPLFNFGSPVNVPNLGNFLPTPILP